MKKSTPVRKSPSPVVTAGVILLAVAAAAIIAVLLWPDGDASTRRTQPQNPAEQSGTPPGNGFRDDALLTFTSPEGETRISIVVEVASTDEERTQGLMGRTAMDEKQGMLFLFPYEEMRSFWMVNTPLPLDIIYLNGDRRIVTVQRNTVPFSDESVPSTAPAQYVVEVNAGFCDRHGVQEGDQVSWLLGGA